MPEIELEGRRLELSNLDKVMYPETGFTKAQLIDYYSRISLVMLPHLGGRPVTLIRYPDGVKGDHFFERECPPHPGWVDTFAVPSKTRPEGVHYCLVDNLATLVWLANLAALEFHTFLFCCDNRDRPVYLVFDLDPGAPAGIEDCAWVALRIRELMEEKGLECCLKTSGRKGIHVCVPLNGTAGFKPVKEFAREAACVLESRYPKRVTTDMQKYKRGGKVFIDWGQNDRGKSTCAVYSLRGTARPQVSTPLLWDEVEDAVHLGEGNTLFFEPWEVIKRAGDHGDIFSPVLKKRQDLPA